MGIETCVRCGRIRNVSQYRMCDECDRAAVARETSPETLAKKYPSYAAAGHFGPEARRIARRSAH
jgi:NMD protein affecting ribosome stability and mRNA decay